MTLDTSLEIDVHGLKAKLETGSGCVILDVRSAQELEIARLPGVVHIPLERLSFEMDQLPRDQQIVVMCHHGSRSLMATLALRQAGFDNAVNLRGGIHAWSRQIDSSVPIY